MNKIYNKYGFYYNLVRLLVELEFNPDMYYKLKVNGMLYNYDTHGEWKYFTKK